MRWIHTLLLCLALTSVTPAIPVPQELERCYSRLHQAWVDLDLERILSFFSNDAGMLDGRGVELDRRGIEEAFSQDLKGAERCDITYKLISARERPPAMVVHTETVRTLTYPRAVVRRVSEREDSWQLLEGGWKLTYVRFLTQTSHLETRKDRTR